PARLRFRRCSTAWRGSSPAAMGIAESRLLIAATRATATGYTLATPAGVGCGIGARRSRSDMVRTIRPSRSRRLGGDLQLRTPLSVAADQGQHQQVHQIN